MNRNYYTTGPAVGTVGITHYTHNYYTCQSKYSTARIYIDNRLTFSSFLCGFRTIEIGGLDISVSVDISGRKLVSSGALDFTSK